MNKWLYSLAIIVILSTIVLLTRTNLPSSGLAIKDPVGVFIHLEPEYANVNHGETVVIGITLVQFGENKRHDVKMDLIIKGKNGEVITTNSETLALGSEVSIVREIKLPEEVKADSYTIIIEVRDGKTNELIGSTSQRILSFDNVKIRLSPSNMPYIIIIIIIIAIMILVMIALIIIHNHLLSKSQKINIHLNKSPSIK